MRDGALPYGVNTLVLRIEWPAPARPRGYNGRMWRMRPLRGWTGGFASAQVVSQLDDEAVGPSTTTPVIGSERVEAQRERASDDVSKGGLAQGSQTAPDVRYAQRGPPGRARPPGGTGGRALNDSELFRLERYNAMRSRLEEIDPRNRELQKQYVTGPEGFVPSQAEVDALGRALESARSSGPMPQGPVNTFNNPGGPAVPRVLGSDVKNIGIQVQGRFPTTPQTPNTVMYRADSNGTITSYQVWAADGFPAYRVDTLGASHGGVPTPHVTEFGRNFSSLGQVFVGTPSFPRPATSKEIP